MNRTVGLQVRLAAAALAGAIIGGGLMCGIAYTHGTDMKLGALAGAVLVGALGHGVEAGTMSRVTLCSVLFGLFFCMIGPGFDDYSGMALVLGTLLGAVVGWLLPCLGLAAAESKWPAKQSEIAARGGTGEV
jgi:hypothetical protein